MQIQCRSCDAVIPAEDVNLDKVLAKCRQCNAVFDFSAQVKMAPSAAKAKRDRGEVAMPASFTVEVSGQALQVTRKWARAPAIFFLIFSGFWNTIVSVFVIGAASGAMKDESGAAAGAFIWVFLTPFIAIGIATGYAAIALLLNITVIAVRDGTLNVKHGPIRWPGNRAIAVADLDQLYCAEYVAYTQNRVPQYRTALFALTKAGDRIKLVPGMDAPEQGVYLEQLLERHLGIEDRPVSGENWPT